VSSSIRREVDDNFAVLGYYAASSFLFFTLEGGADTLSRNVGKHLPYSLRNNPDERSYNHAYDLAYY
jgi:hypothetical protein